MSNFNEFFKSRGAKTIVERFVGSADIFNTKVKIATLSHSIIEEANEPASYYVENGLTATFKVRVEYTTTDAPDDIKYSEFEIPKEIEGVFIIEGAYRIATNTLSSDHDVRIRMSGSGDYIICFDYDRKYDIDHRVLKVKRNDPDLKLIDRDIKIKYEDIDGAEGEIKELLKLTEYQTKKFQIKLDLDYKPEYITTRLINDCLAFGDDRLKDLIIDKTIESVPTNFMRQLFRSNNGRTYNSARRHISSYFIKYGRLADQLTIISSMAIRIFKGSSDSKGDTGVQVPPGINAANLESLGNKITIPETVAFNPTFADIIDFADTPINTPNIQNSLNVCVKVTDNGVLYSAYNLEFQRVSIMYIDYLNTKVASSEFVDYKERKLKPDASGMVEVKYRMKRKMIKVEEVELIDLEPDFRLSETTRRIPFVNYTDSVRISMGTGMIKQAIPLVNAQRPLVGTGHKEELADNVLNEKFKYDEGTVKEITESNIVIELPSGDVVNHPRRTAIQSQNDVCVYTEPKVKVGQKIKKGDIISGATNLTTDTYKSGVNTLVLFHAYFGHINEDALVVSESFANRCVHYSLIDLQLNIKNTAALKWIAPIGTRVKSGDNVVGVYKTNRLDEVNRVLAEKLGGIFSESSGKSITDFTTEDYLKVPNNIEEAYVSDVLIQEQLKPKIPKSVKKPDYSFSQVSREVADEYNKNADRKIIYEKFPEYVASDRLRPINMSRDEYKVVFTVRIRLIKRTILMVGSKVTNSYGGKGVVSVIKPDELMPIMVDKSTGKQYRVEAIMNPYSTINRKIAGVLMEMSLGNCVHRIYDLVEEYKRTKTGQKKIKPLLEKYYPGRYTDLTVDEFIDLHNSKPIEEVYYLEVGCFSDFTPEIVDKWMKELGVESQSEILMPESEVSDLGELKEVLDPEEYEKVRSEMAGKFVPVQKKLQCGWMTLEELYHIPSYSSKVTTSMFGDDISSKRNEPILGKGRYRTTGQKISEDDLAALLSRNAREFITESRKDTVKEDNQLFLNNLLALGLTISDEEGFNQGGSSLKNDLKTMKAKFRLKNQGKG